MPEKYTWILANLPLQVDIESRSILKRLPPAHAALAELKGIAATIPDQNILINTLGLQEAKDSSAIENIITTHDDLYKTALDAGMQLTPAAKEVQNYIEAAKLGFGLIQEKRLLTSNVMLKIQEMLEGNNAGFRKLPGTSLKNATTGEVIYIPPQHPDEIMGLMQNLENYINTPTLDDFDPLVKMAIIHLQFESIHPFYDGNGRTGRIINILYLILTGLQSLPVFYLSNYIIKNKGQYYNLLQEVRTTGSWENWLLYMIEGVERTAKETIVLIEQIKGMMMQYQQDLQPRYKFFSSELLYNLFKHPYTKIEFLERDLGVSRITAAGYLNTLAKDGILSKHKLGNNNYYVNQPLFGLLSNR
jgi:Fic family protein